MRKIKMLNRISIDGYFASTNEEALGMEWFIHDPEVDKSAHLIGGKMDTLILGSGTFRIFERFWVPFLGNPDAPPQLRAVAEELTAMDKLVISNRLQASNWLNTRFCADGWINEAQRMKEADGSDILVLGSGSIVRQLAARRLIDEYMFIVTPVALGSGESLFHGGPSVGLALAGSQAFASGNVLLHYKLGQ